MIPRSVASAAAILISFVQSVVASGSLNLRRASAVDATSSSSGAKIVYASAGRFLEGVDLAQCYEDMVAVANERNILTKDAYFYFCDIMSNQWFSENGIFDYDAFPYDMKFAFVTLSCECIKLGGGENCCQNHRAHLNVDGANGQEVTQAQTNYLNDICTLTHSTIGSDRMNPKPGDMPTTAQPTPPPTNKVHTRPPTNKVPTPPPTKKVDPIITPPTPAPRPVDPPGGIGPGGVVGVAMAAAAVLALLLFLIAGRKDEEDENEEEAMDDIEADDMMKVDVNADLNGNAPGKDDSPDGTKSMTNSVFSEQSTIVTAVTANSNTNMLPGMEDSENESSIFTDEECYDEPIDVPSDNSSLSRCVIKWWCRTEAISYRSPSLPLMLFLFYRSSMTLLTHACTFRLLYHIQSQSGGILSPVQFFGFATSETN